MFNLRRENKALKRQKQQPSTHGPSDNSSHHTTEAMSTSHQSSEGPSQSSRGPTPSMGLSHRHPFTPGGLLASVYHLTRIEYGIDQPEEVAKFLVGWREMKASFWGRAIERYHWKS
ncbi:hypothetical protein Fmac_001020 [Flemingia macrophylla]|uniref:Uncharacterized protein n=1 Tax=Flemingia macrophylla TaxID=520843 RepID=A0ABD1NFX1_9FABA